MPRHESHVRIDLILGGYFGAPFGLRLGGRFGLPNPRCPLIKEVQNDLPKQRSKVRSAQTPDLVK